MHWKTSTKSLETSMASFSPATDTNRVCCGLKSPSSATNQGSRPRDALPAKKKADRAATSEHQTMIRQDNDVYLILLSQEYLGLASESTWYSFSFFCRLRPVKSAMIGFRYQSRSSSLPGQQQPGRKLTERLMLAIKAKKRKRHREAAEHFLEAYRVEGTTSLECRYIRFRH